MSKESSFFDQDANTWFKLYTVYDIMYRRESNPFTFGLRRHEGACMVAECVEGNVYSVAA